MNLPSNPVGERLKQFFAFAHLSTTRVAKACNFSPHVLLKAVEPGGQDKLTLPRLYAIFSNFPTLNPMWLLFGVGEMVDDWQSNKSWRTQIQALEVENMRLQAKLEAYQDCLGIYKEQLSKKTSFHSPQAS